MHLLSWIKIGWNKSNSKVNFGTTSSSCITTPEIICDVFSFLDKDRIERIQLVSQFWNNIIISHKNILPLRQLARLHFTLYNSKKIRIYLKAVDSGKDYVYIKFDGKNLRQFKVSSWYKLLKNLNDVVFYEIKISEIPITYCETKDLDNLLNLMKLVTTKSGGRFRGKFGIIGAKRFFSKLNEIVDNYIIVDELTLSYSHGPDSYIREVCTNPEIVQLPSTPREIRLKGLEFEENDELLHLTCNGKLNGANRLTIEFLMWSANYGNFIRQWFELYRTHQNPISLVGKFKLKTANEVVRNNVLGAVKTFLSNTQLSVKYSFETIELQHVYGLAFQLFNRRCVLHDTDSYALVIEMTYRNVANTNSINASDLDQPSFNKMETISFCVKSL